MSKNRTTPSTSTNIYEQLLNLYLQSGRSAEAMQEDIQHYFRVGYVFCTPEYFIMGRSIQHGWYVYAAVGTGALEGFLRFMPYYLPHIGWERRGGKTRWYKTDKLRRKLYGFRKSSSTDTASLAEP